MTGGDCEFQEQQDGDEERDGQQIVWYITRDRGLTEFYDVSPGSPTHLDTDGEPVYGDLTVSESKRINSFQESVVHNILGLELKPGHVVAVKIFVQQLSPPKRLRTREFAKLEDGDDG